MAIITSGLDGCLFLFTEGEWQKLISGVESAPLTKKNIRDWARYLTNNAQNIDFDSQGRILIPEYLRDIAKLSKDTVIVGSLNRVEIWDRVSYHQYLDTVIAASASIAESIESQSKQE
jgi:MraZ protein